jgi:hypothetical protein
MGPLAAGLFVGASFLTSVYANRQASKAEAASIRLQTEQARLQASEAALERTKAFRQNVSQNLALSGMGFGSTTALAVANAESLGAYAADINALKKQEQFVVASGESARAQNRAKKFSSDLGSLESSISLASKLGLFA